MQRTQKRKAAAECRGQVLSILLSLCQETHVTHSCGAVICVMY